MRDTAVFGLGYFGKFHARDHASLGHLAYIADKDIQKEKEAKDLNAGFLSADLTKIVQFKKDKEGNPVSHKIKKLSPKIKDFLGKTKNWDIATPPEDHFPLMLLGLEFGKNIFVEKPPAERVSEIQYIIERFPETKIGVDYIEMAQPVVVFLKELMLENKFVPAYFFHRRSKNKMKEIRRSREPINSMVVLEELVHDLSEIDFFRTFISKKSFKDSPPELIKRWVQTWQELGYDSSSDARARFSLEFPDGVRADVEGGFSDPEIRQFIVINKNWASAFYGNTLTRPWIKPLAAEVSGEGNIKYLLEAIRSAKIINQQKEEDILKKVRASIFRIPNKHNQPPLLTMIRNFYQAKSNHDLICPLSKALEYQKIVEEVYRA